MLPLLRVLMPLLNVAALVLVASRRRILRSLRRVEATSEDRATTLTESGLSAWWIKRLKNEGVVRRTAAGAYWLDPAAYRHYRQVRLIRVAVVLVIATAVWLFLKAA